MALPYLLMWIVSFPLAYIADLLIIKGYTTITVSRKLWNTVGKSIFYFLYGLHIGPLLYIYCEGFFCFVLSKYIFIRSDHIFLSLSEINLAVFFF